MVRSAMPCIGSWNSLSGPYVCRSHVLWYLNLLPAQTGFCRACWRHRLCCMHFRISAGKRSWQGAFPEESEPRASFTSSSVVQNIQLLQNRLAFYDVHQGFFRHHLSGIQLKIIVYKALFLLRSVLDNYLGCSRFEGGCFLLRRTKCLIDSFYIDLVLPVSKANWMLAQSWGQASIHLHNFWCIVCKLLRAACIASRFCPLEQAFYAANEVSWAFPAPDFLFFFFPTRLLRTGFFLAIYFVGINKNFRLFILVRVT